MTSSKPTFVHVGTDEELEALREYAFEGVNVCTKRKVADNGGWFLVFLGAKAGEDGKGYSGHRYIIRCRNPDMQKAAAKIVRERLQIVGDAND